MDHPKDPSLFGLGLAGVMSVSGKVSAVMVSNKACQ